MDLVVGVASLFGKWSRCTFCGQVGEGADGHGIVHGVKEGPAVYHFDDQSAYDTFLAALVSRRVVYRRRAGEIQVDGPIACFPQVQSLVDATWTVRFNVLVLLSVNVLALVVYRRVRNFFIEGGSVQDLVLGSWNGHSDET